MAASDLTGSKIDRDGAAAELFELGADGARELEAHKIGDRWRSGGEEVSEVRKGGDWKRVVVGATRWGRRFG